MLNSPVKKILKHQTDNETFLVSRDLTQDFLQALES